MKIGILGAGLSGTFLAHLLEQEDRVEEVELLEKEEAPGGLCRSHPFGKLHYDIGPHIVFSKDPKILDLMVGLLGENSQRLRRANKIFHDGRFVKYPFENELSALSPEEIQYCLSSFLDNPYADYAPQTMLQFFLATFGEGITNLFLRPYNEKIWKFDPSFMDTQMVDRIPKPPAEDIINSSKGIATEGYLHQLYFYYPKQGGIESLYRGLLCRLGRKAAVHTGVEVRRVALSGGGWIVTSADGAERRYDRLVSTIPLPTMIQSLRPEAPREVAEAARRLKSNSIAICMFRVRGDRLGDNLAVQVADRSILFHRITKLNYLLPAEADDGTASLMAEVTYRRGSPLGGMSNDDLLDRLEDDMVRAGFISGREAVLERGVRRAEHAYVIYDLDHRRNMSIVRGYCEEQLGLWLHGRFGEFVYANMDACIARSFEKHRVIKGSL